MGWLPLFTFTFENHAAVDETRNANHGIVELPSADKWIDRPDPKVATGVLYDNGRTKVVVPTRPSFAGWAGFKVTVVFRPDDFHRRINLVEGDASFALFVEFDGSLRGTINDGKHFYGVTSKPGMVRPGFWYLAEFLYDPATMLILRLNQTQVAFLITHGDPVLPVGPAGIRIGYWPGGDDRYTFLGLIGPVSVSTLDPATSLLVILGKLVCGQHGAGRLEELLPVVESELTTAEKARLAGFGDGAVNAVRRVLAATLGSAADKQATLARLRDLSDRAVSLLISDEEAGRDLFDDPALAPVLDEAYRLILSTSGNARDALLAQAVELVASRPLSAERLAEVLAHHPNLCTNGPGSVWVPGNDPASPGGPLGSIIDHLCELCGGSSNPGGAGSDPRGTGRAGEPGAGRCCEVHVHIDCPHGRGTDCG